MPETRGDSRIHWLYHGTARYAERHGFELARVDVRHVVGCPERGRRIGTAYLAAPVFESAAVPFYEAFRTETLRQLDWLTRPASAGGVGLHVVVTRSDPYLNIHELLHDIRDHERLRVWSTGECGNPHPWLSNSDNDAFRGVHDAFGHAAHDVGFDGDGEEGAWLAHAHLYSPFARRALASETRGQQSAMQYLLGGRFPEQKACLLSPEFSDPRTVTFRSRRTSSGKLP